MAKNQSLPAPFQEKYSRGEENLTMYEHHGKPTAWWLRPNLSNPRSTNDIVWAFYVRAQHRYGSSRIESLHHLFIIQKNYESKFFYYYTFT